MKKLWVVILMLICSSLYAQTTESQKNSLLGLKGVMVMVADLDPKIKSDGLTESSIQTDVESKLRIAGIKVLTRDENLKEPGNPYLYIKVNSHTSGNRVHAFQISIKLNQTVFLGRNLKIKVVDCTTWFRVGSIGSIGALNVSSLRDDIKDLVDKFTNDYLSVNSK